MSVPTEVYTLAIPRMVIESDYLAVMVELVPTRGYLAVGVGLAPTLGLVPTRGCCAA